MSAKWRPAIDAGHGRDGQVRKPSGPPPASHRAEIGVPFGPPCGCGIRRAATGPRGSVPPPVAARALPVEAPGIRRSRSSVRRRNPRNSSRACPGPVTVVAGSPGRRDLRRRACPADPLPRTPECCRVAARIRPCALRHAKARPAAATGGPPPDEGETARTRVRAIRDLLRDPGRSHRLAGGSPRHRPPAGSSHASIGPVLSTTRPTVRSTAATGRAIPSDERLRVPVHREQTLRSRKGRWRAAGS